MSDAATRREGDTASGVPGDLAGSPRPRVAASIRLENLSKRFGDVLAVDAVSLEVVEGELLTLLGPSGCGKTTTLRMIAGFERATSGRVFFGERDVTSLPSQRRGAGMVFQNYALFPHLDVFENVAFGLKARRVPRAELAGRVEAALARVDLPGFGARKVQELSGGQQQRVALARALAPEPPVLLLDEPLSNLDAALRERTRGELRTLLKRLGITSIFVTHDQEEAFALSDRIAILRAGRLQQVGTPEALYARPANPFVAAFLGRANLLPGRVVAGDGLAVTVELASGGRWECEWAGGQGSKAATSPDEVLVMIRPEALALQPADAARDARDLRVVVEERRFTGALTHYLVRAADLELLVQGGTVDGRVGEEALVRPTSASRPLVYPRE